jgi:hypothetical protein
MPISLASCQPKNEPDGGSGFPSFKKALLVPFRASTFSFSLEFQHTLSAFQFNVRRITVPFSYFFLGQHLGEAAPALGTGGFDMIFFFAHDGPPSRVNDCSWGIFIADRTQYRCHWLTRLPLRWHVC